MERSIQIRAERFPVNTTIQLLKKVTLSLRAGSKPGTYNMTGSPVSIEFVYGVASDGVCQFESALDGKQTGHKLTFSGVTPTLSPKSDIWCLLY